MRVVQREHGTTVQETNVNNKEKQSQVRKNAQQLRRDSVHQKGSSALDLNRHGLWLDSPQAHAWNTLISSEQPKMSRAGQISLSCSSCD